MQELTTTEFLHEIPRPKTTDVMTAKYFKELDTIPKSIQGGGYQRLQRLGFATQHYCN